MPPIWPFRKKSARDEDSAPEVVEYDRVEDARKKIASLEDRSHVEDTNFQAALSALSTPHLGIPESGTPAPTTVGGENPEPTKGSQDDWIKHTDGYWYRKKPDGTFDKTPHVEDSNGQKTPYV